MQEINLGQKAFRKGLLNRLEIDLSNEPLFTKRLDILFEYIHQLEKYCDELEFMIEDDVKISDEIMEDIYEQI